MSDIPKDLRYTESHEWLELQDDGNWRVGITDHAQSQLGELVFVELPEVETDVGSGDACGVVESVKAASDIYAPITGSITAINDSLEDEPDLINTDCYGDGWLFETSSTDDAQLDELMDAEQYADLIAD